MSQSTFRFPRVLPQEQVRVTSDSDGTELVAQLRAGLNGEVPNYLGPDGVTTLYLQSEAGTATVTGDEVGDGSEAAPSGGTSVAGQVFGMGRAPGPGQAVPDSSWEQMDLTKWSVVQDQPWATIDGNNLLIDPTQVRLVDVQVWIGWPAATMTGDVRGMNLAHAGGGGIEHLDDFATMMSPAQYAALDDFESSMGVHGINRVDPDTGLTLQLFVYQDSGADLTMNAAWWFVTAIA